MLVTRHDYRSGWRANFHFIAEAFRRNGSEVDFFSTGFSYLSKHSLDKRNFLDSRANDWEVVDGINCFLWKTPVHPIRVRPASVSFLMDPVFELWSRYPCKELDRCAGLANLIIVESDLSAVLIDRLRRASPAAKIIYLASDLLETIGAAPQIELSLRKYASQISGIIAVSRNMIDHLAALGRPTFFVSHGIEPNDFSRSAVNPYSMGTLNAVTVGSMLFDPYVIDILANAFPNVFFHLIGTSMNGSAPKNVIEHGTLPFFETIPWLRYADVGIAPYRSEKSARYLADSSFKLMQYGYLGLPAICPHFAVGDFPNRFGYTPGDRSSVIAAYQRALAQNGDRVCTPTPSWSEIAMRICDIAAELDPPL